MRAELEEEMERNCREALREGFIQRMDLNKKLVRQSGGGREEKVDKWGHHLRLGPHPPGDSAKEGMSAEIPAETVEWLKSIRDHLGSACLPGCAAYDGVGRSQEEATCWWKV